MAPLNLDLDKRVEDILESVAERNLGQASLKCKLLIDDIRETTRPLRPAIGPKHQPMFAPGAEPLRQALPLIQTAEQFLNKTPPEWDSAVAELRKVTSR